MGTFGTNKGHAFFRTAVVLAILGLALRALAAEPQTRIPTLEVVGAGTVAVAPDQATVHLGVLTEAATAAAALAANNQAVGKLFDVLKRSGVAERDIQTAQFAVAARYSQERPLRPKPPEIVAYQVTNVVRVTIRKLSELGKILDAAVQAGSNQIHGVSFGVANPKPLLDQARRQAIADARHKAEVYAEAAGVRLGRILLITEPRDRPLEPARFFAGAEMQMAREVPTAPGELQLDVEAQVHYELKQEL